VNARLFFLLGPRSIRPRVHIGAPSDDRESAILASLPAGAYTAIITGAGNTTGIARVDVFNVQ
jgi:hypothetical protein